MAVESELLAQINRPRRISTAHQGREHSDAELQRVAEVYMVAYKAHLPVQKIVANAFGVSVSTAAKRIMVARRKGFITIDKGDVQ
jgi:DNA-binding transcriptional regulator LsrR (DeoR family)